VKTEERFKLPVSFMAEGIVWMAIPGNVQLGLRHPQNIGPSADMARRAAKQILKELRDKGVLTEEEAAQIYRDEMRVENVGR